MNAKASPVITQEIFDKWQKKIDLMAQIIDVPVGLIMKVHSAEIEVFVSSHTDGNPYQKGDREELNIGLYCETVMATKKMLEVPNATIDEDWNRNPDIKLGMINYMGLPLLYPNGDLFGTVCILDSKQRKYSKLQMEILDHFKDSLEGDLQLECEEIHLNQVLKELKEIQTEKKQIENGI